MGSPFYLWEEKIHRVKKALKNWEKSIETPTPKKEKAGSLLKAHQIAMETKQISDEGL